MTFTFTIALTPTAIAQHKTFQCSTTFAVQYSYSADTVQLQYGTVHFTLSVIGAGAVQLFYISRAFL